jgi:hypothetical protein
MRHVSRAAAPPGFSTVSFCDESKQLSLSERDSAMKGVEALGELILVAVVLPVHPDLEWSRGEIPSSISNRCSIGNRIPKVGGFSR